MFYKFLLGLILSFLFLYFVFSDINLDELRTSLAQIKITHIALAILIIMSFYLIRAYRWKLLVDDKVSYMDAFYASSLSYFFSLILVFQAGELSKIHILKNKYNIDRSYTASTIIIERMLDLSALTVFFLISLAYFSLENTFLSFMIIILGLFFLILLIFSKQIFLWLRGTFLHQFIHSSLLKFKLGQYIIEMYKSLTEAFFLLNDIRLKVALLTIILWTVNFSSILVFLGKYGNLFEILGGFSLLSLGVAAQATPANIGQYEFIWTAVFEGIVNVPIEQLVASGIVLHAVIVGVISLFALLSWLISLIK